MRISDAVPCFLSGFTATRSFTHPYLVESFGPIWVMRDGPRKPTETERVREMVAYDISIEEALQTARDYGQSHRLCYVHPMDADPDQVRDAFKATGYRLIVREPLMFSSTGVELAPVPGFEVRQVTTKAEADLVNKGAGARQILPVHWQDPASSLQMFAAWQGEFPVGWVRSIRTHEDRAWVAGMYVRPEFRRRGLGSALMRTMMASQAQRGVANSVLLASNVGTQLYNSLGYTQIGLLQMFSLKR